MNAMLNASLLKPILVAYAVATLASVVVVACYPKNCDPSTDPLKCRCPPGACGDYPPAPSPELARDAGAADAAKPTARSVRAWSRGRS